MRPRGVLFLGSGATAGSGIKKEGYPLPTDSGFFDSPLVTSRLAAGYPALHLARNELLPQPKSSLYETWNDLFVFRGFARTNVIEGDEVQGAWRRLQAYRNRCRWNPPYWHQHSHYDCQFQIREDDGESKPVGYYLGELAIWDLRSLLVDVYRDVHRAPSPYRRFWQGLRNQVSSVVNLNYDTTFDDHQPDEFQAVFERELILTDSKPLLIRPHGSLGWTSANRYKRRWLLRWKPSPQACPRSELGYRRTATSGVFAFRQPHIVAPPSFKEEVVGTSSEPGLTDDVLRAQWRTLAKQARDAHCWIFVGLSLQAGDDHLLHLLQRQRLYTPQKRLHCTCYGTDDVCRRLETIFGPHAEVCSHEIPVGRTIDRFLNQRGCDLLG